MSRRPDIQRSRHSCRTTHISRDKSRYPNPQKAADIHRTCACCEEKVSHRNGDGHRGPPKTQFERTPSAMAANNIVTPAHRSVKHFLIGRSDFCRVFQRRRERVVAGRVLPSRPATRCTERPVRAMPPLMRTGHRWRQHDQGKHDRRTLRSRRIPSNAPAQTLDTRPGLHPEPTRDHGRGPLLPRRMGPRHDE